MDGVTTISVALRKSISSDLLVNALDGQPDFRVAEFVNSSQDLLRTAEAGSIDTVLLGTTSEETPQTYLRTLQRVRAEHPRIKCIVLFSERDPSRIVDVFRFGAKGVVNVNETSFNLLCRSVGQIQAGQIWANHEEQEWIMSALESTTEGYSPAIAIEMRSSSAFSKREEEVVALLMTGMSNREIAGKLQLSEHTIKNYFFRMFEKLGVSSRNELLVHMIKTSWTGNSLQAGVAEQALIGRSTRS